MDRITICINTAKNERHYLELLFKSLYKNLSRRDHDIIVFVDTDNQNSSEFLVSQKQFFPNLTIIKNPLPIPISYQRNINLMFEMAKTDVVSYLQSDMVIGPSYDLEVVKHLTPNTIISATRIEPPLHPPSPEKITHDFGLDPQKFDLDVFSSFAEKYKKNEITDFWFAPFTLYRKNWTDIGGHDTLFRSSREDSDLLYRFSMMGLKIKQVWNALVYHFSCISSRGPEWWTEKHKQKEQLRMAGDFVEINRFLRKWPFFKHSTAFDPDTEYKYQISANFYNAAPKDYDLLQYYFLFHRIFIDNPSTRSTIKHAFKKLHEPANSRLNISDLEWDKYKKYYRTWEYEDIYSEYPIVDDDVIYNVDLKGEIFGRYKDSLIYSKMQEIIHSNRTECPGEFEIEGEVKIIMNRAINHIQDNLIVHNPPIDDISFQIL